MWKKMHKEKVLGMSHEGFLKSGTQKEYILWEFSLDVNFKEYFKCLQHSKYPIDVLIMFIKKKMVP